LNAATTAASQTSTVAPIQVPIPSIESPSVTRTVTISEASCRDQRHTAEERPRRATELHRQERLEEREDNVKTTTATTKPVTSRLIPSRTAAATISPTALAARAITVRTMSRSTRQP